MSKRYYEDRERERKDGGMLREEGSVANMPKEIKYHEWPSDSKYLDEFLPGNLDTISGIDSQIREDIDGARRHRSRSKY